MYSLVAVSGGSDSMALLDKLRKEKKDLIVCHVNYGFRESSLRDENIVRKYCDKYNLKLEILKNIKYDNKENLENFARVTRYNFFKDIYIKYNCDCLYVGHNKDDLIETYLLQKRRDAKCDYYGLKEEIYIYEMKVKRILLDYSKKELEEYCKSNDIEYGVDETNFDMSYVRNDIRHNIVFKMSAIEKDKIVEEINKLNEEKEKEYERVHNLLDKCKCGNNSFDIDIYDNYSDDDKLSVLYYFVIENVKVKISIKESRLVDIIKKISSSKPNIELGRFEDFILYKEYGAVTIKKEEKEYCYLIEDLNSNLGEFEIKSSGKKLEKVVVSQNSFPLKIESYKGDNKIINRLFIDKKIPISERKRWPIVKDKLDNVLLVLNIKKFYNNKVLDDKVIEFYIKRKEKERV